MAFKIKHRHTKELEAVDLVNLLAAPVKAQGVRQRLDYLEQELKKLPQVPITTRHFFAHGLYAREIAIPKGTLLTGLIHTTEHLNIISKGDISVLTEQGPKRVQAPYTMVSPPGTKRAGYAHEDTVWTTIHANGENLQDIDQLEAVLIAPDYESVPLTVIDV